MWRLLKARVALEGTREQDLAACDVSDGALKVNVNSAVQISREFQQRVSLLRPITIHVGDPWHASDSWKEPFPFADDIGVYLYSRPTEGVWQIKAEDNVQPVWYIGVSNAIGGRARDHLGVQYEPGSKYGPCVPRFKYHRWSELAYVPADSRDSIAAGAVVIYPLGIRGSDTAFSRLASEMLEKHLLVQHIFASSALPVLNLSL